MGSESAKSGQGTNKASQDRQEADGYEFRLEIAGSLLLIFIGFLVWWFGGDLGKAVGANLLAAGGVGLLVFVVYGRVFGKRRQRLSAERGELLEEIAEACRRLEDRTEMEESQIQEAIASGVPQTVSEFHAAKKVGLAGFNAERPTKKINEAVLGAEETVDILEVSLKTMRHIDTSDWRACQASVRIILLDPLFPKERPLALQRDSEEGQTSGQILKEVYDILDMLPDEWLASDNGGSDGASEEDRVRLARVMPTLSYFRIDGVAYFAPLVHKQLGDLTMHLRLSQGGGFFDALTDHFDKLWNDEVRVKPVRPGDIPQEYTV